ncbi:MAG: zf-HC2 domain-containing protein [Thermodesulfobacteriota bacterium]
MEHKSEFQELISLYALSALDEHELWEFEEHLKTGCGVCHRLLKDTESVLSLLAYSLQDIPLSPGVHEKVLLRIDAA